MLFIAMNRFRVKKGSEDAFEKVWLSRESYLDRMPGFIEFHLLKGPEGEDHTLYASHTVWQNKASFEAWTKSDEFRAAHARAPATARIPQAASARRHSGKGSGRSRNAPGSNPVSGPMSAPSSAAVIAARSIPEPMNTSSCRRSPNGSAQLRIR